jgi:hypothetical protein
MNLHLGKNKKGEKMKKFTKLLLVFLVSGSVAFANAQNQNVSKKDGVITQKDIQEQNKLNEPLSPEKKIDDWKKEFLKKMGIPSFGEVNGKMFYFAKETVSVPATDPQFGQALANAYDKAFLDIMKQYAKDMYARKTVTEIRDYLEDLSPSSAKIDLPSNYRKGFWGKVLAVMDKSLEVANKKLDKKLIDLGVDPKELETMTPKEKKDLFKDKFLKKIITTASGDISGIFTIQSAWASDTNGNYAVGVIAVVSQKTKQIAKDISYNRLSLIRGKGRDINSLIPRSPKQLVKTLGTRLAYDKDGTPVIISYGIKSYVPRKNHYINARLEENAIEGAIDNADAQIAMLVNGYLNLKTIRESNDETKDYIERELKPDSETMEKIVNNIIDKTIKHIKATASMRIQGITTYKTWSYTMPSGQKIVGAVRVWKYSTLQNIKKFKEGYKRNINENNQNRKQFNAGFGESKIINDLNDF